MCQTGGYFDETYCQWLANCQTQNAWILREERGDSPDHRMPMIGVSKLRHVVDGVIAVTASTGGSIMELTLGSVMYCSVMLIFVKSVMLD